MKCFVFTFKLCFCCFNFVSLCHVLRPFGNLCQDPVACGRCSENRLEFSISWDWFIIDRMIAKLWHQAAKASLASGEKVCLPPVEFRKGAKICLKFTDVNHEGVIPLKHFWIKKKKRQHVDVSGNAMSDSADFFSSLRVDIHQDGWFRGGETFTRIFSHCTKSGRIFRVGCLSVLFVETI